MLFKLASYESKKLQHGQLENSYTLGPHRTGNPSYDARELALRNPGAAKSLIDGGSLSPQWSGAGRSERVPSSHREVWSA